MGHSEEHEINGRPMCLMKRLCLISLCGEEPGCQCRLLVCSMRAPQDHPAGILTAASQVFIFCRQAMRGQHLFGIYIE